MVIRWHFFKGITYPKCCPGKNLPYLGKTIIVSQKGKQGLGDASAGKVFAGN